MKKILLILLCLPMIGFGQCISGDCKNGYGKYNSNDIIYQGEWKDGKCHGLGTMSFLLSGDKYVGQWKNNNRHGQGTFTWANGDKYVGEFKNNIMYGRGTYESSDGYKYVGEWKNDKKNGQGTMTFNGDKYVGEFKNDTIHGKGTYTSADGAVWTGLWVDGEQFEGHYEDENYYDINHIYGDVNYTIVNLHKIKSNGKNKDSYNLKLSFSGIEQNFVFDTGCTGLTINKDFFYRLESAGLIEKKLKSDSAQIANNDWVSTEKYIISNIKIGDYTLNNVVISVLNKGSFLCGLGVFKKFRNVEWNMAKSYLKLYK